MRGTLADMDILAEFGRVFFGALYDLRIPVAIGSIVAAIAFVVIAWRRGWIAAARRHPGRSSVVLAAALAVGLPLTWYLASPIFLRTQLIEPELVGVISTPTPTPPASDAPSASPSPSTDPTVAPSAEPSAAEASPDPSTGASAPPGANPTPRPTAKPTPKPTAQPTPKPTAKPTPAPFQPIAILSGEFYGSDDFHYGSGTATVIEIEPGRYRLRLSDFSVRNGPDLYVYLSPSAEGYANGALEIGVLKATDGSFGYDLPAGLDPTDFRSTIIWCKQFSHLFATAPFD